MKELAVLDIDLAKVTSCYPVIPGHDTFVKTLRFIYTWLNLKPQLSDFDTRKTSDDGKRTDCAGVSKPIIVRGLSREDTKSVAILKFIHEDLQIPVEPEPPEPNPHPETAEVKTVIGTTDSVHFVTNQYYSRKRFTELAQRYHSSRETMRIDEFMVVGHSDHTHWDEIAICRGHKVEDFSVLDPVARNAAHVKAASAHIVECLNKKVDQAGVLGAAALEPPPEVQQARAAICAKWPLELNRASISKEEWTQGHPYFRFQTYTHAGLILLPKDDVKMLPHNLRQLYSELEEGTLDAEEEKSFRQKLLPGLQVLFDRHKTFGFFMLPFAGCSTWTLSECLKFWVRPPTPRPHPNMRVPFTQATLDELSCCLTFCQLTRFSGAGRARTAAKAPAKATTAKAPAKKGKQAEESLSLSDNREAFTVQLGAQAVVDFVLRADPSFCVTQDRSYAFVRGDRYKTFLAKVAALHFVPVEAVFESIENHAATEPLDKATKWNDKNAKTMSQLAVSN